MSGGISTLLENQLLLEQMYCRDMRNSGGGCPQIFDGLEKNISVAEARGNLLLEQTFTLLRNKSHPRHESAGISTSLEKHNVDGIEWVEAS
ncbi:hypothetical protein V6N11_017105 [Hibiscus sabdariffa]|uniref:Uncharacterized protein n=1 Tax=Hibiscus sabdariffa TaxID=183260 RepID=A0ABR2TXQ6_9ROSI